MQIIKKNTYVRLLSYSLLYISICSALACKGTANLEAALEEANAKAEKAEKAAQKAQTQITALATVAQADEDAILASQAVVEKLVLLSQAIEKEKKAEEARRQAAPFASIAPRNAAYTADAAREAREEVIAAQDEVNAAQDAADAARRRAAGARAAQAAATK